MEEVARARLETLRREFELGQQRLRDLEIEQTRLRETVLRISGAIQVLEEMLAPAGDGGDRLNGSIKATDPASAALDSSLGAPG